mgnify:CR=1 FL=1|jgi:hypothetical protein|nr:MAG TPA: hypothetical protein [Caudoviricetes sp.]
MERTSYKVLVKTDDVGHVTAINSDAFINGEGWTQIDEGVGDRYHHAQNNYLQKPLTDERGVYRYKLVDGMVTQRAQAEMNADFDSRPAPPPTTEERMNALESANDDLILMMADLIGGQK